MSTHDDAEAVLPELSKNSSQDNVADLEVSADKDDREPDLTDTKPALLSSTVQPAPDPPSRPLSPALPVPRRTYKRRFFPLVQLALLNLVVSWAWLTFSASSGTSAAFFRVSESAINWLATGYMFAFVVASPATLWALGRGPKFSMLVSAALLLAGVWMRYIGVKAREKEGGVFGLVVFGQVLTGLAQPFVLAAPTRLSDLWFTEGRIAATALATLANPLGGAVAQLVGPLIATDQSQVPQLVLWTAVITTIATVPTLFIPARPPMPVAGPTTLQQLTPDVHTYQHVRQSSSSEWRAGTGTPLSPVALTSTVSALAPPAPPPLSLSLTSVLRSVRTAARVPAVHLVFWAFAVYTWAFNATSSLLNQILGPYGYSETEAGIDGALLILVGLGCAAVTSPLLDRLPHARLPAIKACVLVLAAGYVGLVFAPRAGLGSAHRSGPGRVGPPFAVSALLGSASFTVVPLALELMVDLCSPVGPEVTSTVAWAAGQLGGGCLILAMDHLTGGKPSEPQDSMYRGLVLQAVLACAVVPLPLMLGWRGLGLKERRGQGDGRPP